MDISAGDILRIVAVLSYLDGDIIMNVFNALIGSGGGPFDPQDIVDDAVDWMDAVYLNVVADMSNNVNGSEIRVYVYDAAEDDWDEVGIDPFTFDPTQIADNTAKGVAGLINAKTTNADVSGKKYLGAVTEDATADGVLNAPYIAALAAFGADWLTDFTGAVSGAAWEPGVWSPTRLEILPFSGTIIIPSEPAYQRRRKSGVGI